jgi:hypothetical protein
LTSISFPLISAGAYGYPEQEAIRVAVKVISDFLETREMDVYLVFFISSIFQKSHEQYPELAEKIERISLTEEKAVLSETKRRKAAGKNSFFVYNAMLSGAHAFREDAEQAEPLPTACAEADSADLASRLKELDESFTEMLLRKIDESGMKDSECYKKANLDRKLFSKIRSNTHYRPKKNTALAFAIALRLSLAETEELLKKAGFALSESNVSDVIIRYFIEKGVYDIFEINEALFDYDQVQLGA